MPNVVNAQSKHCTGFEVTGGKLRKTIQFWMHLELVQPMTSASRLRQTEKNAMAILVVGCVEGELSNTTTGLVLRASIIGAGDVVRGHLRHLTLLDHCPSVFHPFVISCLLFYLTGGEM